MSAAENSPTPRAEVFVEEAPAGDDSEPAVLGNEIDPGYQPDQEARYGPALPQRGAVQMLDATALSDHPLAHTIPEMLRDEYCELVKDIETHGQREAIILYKDKILDGRHRTRACADLGIEVKAITFVGTEDEAKALVNSANVQRRHLTLEQKDLIKQKYRNIGAELQRDPAQSNRAIATKLKVNKNAVAKARAVAEANGQLDH